LIKGLGIGGAEKLISEGAAFWDRESYDYHVAYVLPWKDQLTPQLEALEVPVRCLGGRKGNSVVATARLHRLVKEWNVDLIHAHLPVSGVMARTTRVPVVYTEHNLADSYRQPTRTLNRASYWRNDVVIAVSDAVAGSLTSFPGPTPQVIPNGVTVDVKPEQAMAARDELGLGPEQPLIVHVGNIRPHKGHSTLIAAAAELTRVKPAATIVSIGGEKYSGDLERIRTEAANKGLGDALRFLGRREDALSFVAAADVYVNPADVEGLPVSILEAMALGIPVVATAVGGVPTVIQHDETGLLVEARQPTALATAILDLLDDPRHARHLGNAGQMLVDRDFGLEAMVRSIEENYRQVLID
jgi:glycosyltransferase involved in cell wall biosynthesis